MVCDDAAAKRYVIAGWLRGAGYTVVEAATGSEATLMRRLRLPLYAETPSGRFRSYDDEVVEGKTTTSIPGVRQSGSAPTAPATIG